MGEFVGFWVRVVVVVGGLRGGVGLTKVLSVNYFTADVIVSNVMLTFYFSLMGTREGGVCILSGSIPMLMGRANARIGLRIRYGDRVGLFRALFFALPPSSRFVGCGVRGTVCLVSSDKLGRCGGLGRGKCFGAVLTDSTAMAVVASDVGISVGGLSFRCCNVRHVRQRASVLGERLMAAKGLERVPHARGGPRKLVVAS